MQIGKTISLLYLGMWFGICASYYGQTVDTEPCVFSLWLFIQVMSVFSVSTLVGYLWGKEDKQ